MPVTPDAPLVPGLRAGGDGHAPDPHTTTDTDTDGGGPDPGLVVVGGGAAGLAGAAVARAAGRSVTLVSEGPLGGDCTWHGCVPTKSLLAAAAAGADVAEAVAHARSVVARVARGESEEALRRTGTRVLRERAVLVARHHDAPTRTGTDGDPVVRLPGGLTLRPGVGVLLATGSRPLPPPAALADPPPGVTVVDTDGWLDALEARAGAPGPVVLVGGGPSGVELAQGLARLEGRPPGARGAAREAARAARAPVVLLERAATLLPGLPGAGDVVAASLRADGVDVRTAATDADLADLLRPGTLVLLATGRSPALDVLADGCGVRVEHGRVVVDPAMRTTAARVVAAGDVTGLRPSTHLAVAGARVAVGTLLGHDVRLDPAWSPRVVWSDPQVAVVGEVPPPDGSGARSVRIPVSRNDRAPVAAVPGGTDRSRGGFVRVWVRPAPDGSWQDGGRVVGALVVGPEAGELLGQVAMAGRLGLTVADWLGGRVGLGAVAGAHPYPGWSWVWDAVADRLLGTRPASTDPAS